MLSIKLSRAHKSIMSLDATELPDFAILIGRNGVGKTHLLEALDNGAVAAAGIQATDVEMYDFASFSPGNSASVSYPGVRFAALTADAYFTTQASGKSRRELAKEIYDDTLASIPTGQRHDFDAELRRFIAKMADFSVLPNARAPTHLAEYTVGILDQVLGPMRQRQQGRQQQGTCGNDPAVLVSLAMKLAGKVPHEVNREDILRATHYEGGTISNTISQVFTAYRVDAYLWAHKEFEKSVGDTYDDLIARYQRTNAPPWHSLRKALDEMRERAGDEGLFNFAFSDPADLPLSLSNFQEFKFEAKMTNRTTGSSYDLDSLSSGEKVLMTLVLSTFNQHLGRRRPRLLLLDELDAMLHPSMVAALVSILKTWFVARGTRVLMTSHSPVTAALADDNEIFRITRKAGNVRALPVTPAEGVDELSEGLAMIDTGLRILAHGQAEVTILTEGNNARHLKRWANLNFPEEVGVFEGLVSRSCDSQLVAYGTFLAKANANTHFLIVWDCDATGKYAQLEKQLTATSKVTAFAFSQRPNAIARKGIENLYKEDLLERFATRVVGENGKEGYRIDKTGLANHVYQHGCEEDFTHFGDLAEAVLNILQAK